jgi:hypothetical protein
MRERRSPRIVFLPAALMTVPRILDLSALGDGLPAITPHFGSCLAEAAAVCFEDQRHQSGVVLTLDGDAFGRYSVLYPAVTEQMRRCWNDHEVTTEHGAYAVAIAAIADLTEFTVIERSRKGTGFDYWLGKDSDELFQAKSRLEVSGIRSGDDAELHRRTLQKQRQIRPTGGMSSAYVFVVEFGTPRGRVKVL